MATLFGKAKEAEKAQLLALLQFIVTGTLGVAGHALVPEGMAKRIEKLEPGLIQPVANAIVDAAGNFPVFATANGLAAVNGGVAVEVVKPRFELETGFALPPIRGRGGIKTDVYPFAQMEAGQSFFVPATEAKPNPAKALASTLSSANIRFAATYPATTGKNKKPHPQAGQPTGKDGRRFTVRSRTVADGEKSNGARVYRIS